MANLPNQQPIAIIQSKPQNDTANIILGLFLWIVEAVETVQTNNNQDNSNNSTK